MKVQREDMACSLRSLRLSSCELWLPSPLLSSAALDVLTTRHACYSSLTSYLSSLGESLPSVLDAYAVAVPDVPGYGSRVHTHDHGGSEAPDGLPDSIISSKPKPLEKHRPPPPQSILSLGESSYPP
ncbi:hypothetical protein Tco_1155740 [Tanacetum coccineum]